MDVHHIGKTEKIYNVFVHFLLKTHISIGEERETRRKKKGEKGSGARYTNKNLYQRKNVLKHAFYLSPPPLHVALPGPAPPPPLLPAGGGARGPLGPLGPLGAWHALVARGGLLPLPLAGGVGGGLLAGQRVLALADATAGAASEAARPERHQACISFKVIVKKLIGFCLLMNNFLPSK